MSNTRPSTEIQFDVYLDPHDVTFDVTVVASLGGGSAILYDGPGDNTDGAMTQKATTIALDGRLERPITLGDQGDLLTLDGSMKPIWRRIFSYDNNTLTIKTK